MLIHLTESPSRLIPILLLCLGQAPPTFTDLLLQHHVQITQISLVRALSDPDKEVRGTAAAELAELKMTGTLPQILHAARTEKDAMTQVNLASAALWMGAGEGLQLLTRICGDPAASAWVRVAAARNALARDHACFSALMEMTRPQAEPGGRIMALSTASQIKPLTQRESRMVLHAAISALNDKDLRVRLEACEALRWLQNPKALQPLRAAIGKETEETARQTMRSTLQALERGVSR